MSAHSKQAAKTAKMLVKMSVENGAVSATQVAAVLEYVAAKVSDPVTVLKAYRRGIAVELAKTNAVVEHAGAVNDAVVSSIAQALSKKYGRTISATARPNPALIAGLRVHLGDDVYESSVAGQLAHLSV